VKKLIFILSCIILYLNSHGQTTRAVTSGFSPRANQFFVVEDGILSAKNGLFVPRFTDTTQANTFIFKDTLGAVIYTYDVHDYWGRKYVSGSKRWVAIGSGGGGGSGTVTNIATGLGLSGGPITTTGTLLVDTANASILSRQRAANTYALIGAVSNPLFPVTGTGIATGNVIGSLAGNILTVVESGNEFLNITPTAGSEGVVLQAFNTTAGDNRGGIYGLSDNAAASSSIYADFNASADRADIVLSAASGVTSIAYSAGTHTFTGNFKSGSANTWDLDGNVLTISQAGNEMFHLDPTTNAEHAHLQATNTTGGGNLGFIVANTSDTNAEAFINTGFNGGSEGQIKLTSSASGVIAEYSADTHIFTGNIINSNRTLLKQGDDVASAAGAIALGGDGNSFEITGTAAITLISNLTWLDGSEVTLIFTSTATLTDGTANSGTDIGMELAGNANFTASADDVITLVLSEVGGTQRWREKSRSVN